MKLVVTVVFFFIIHSKVSFEYKLNVFIVPLLYFFLIVNCVHQRLALSLHAFIIDTFLVKLFLPDDLFSLLEFAYLFYIWRKGAHAS